MVREPWLLALVAVAVALLAFGATRVSRRASALHGRPMGLLDHLRELRFRALSVLGTTAGAAMLAFVLDVRRGEVAGVRVWVPAVSVTESVSSRTLAWLLDRVTPDGVRLVVMTPFEAVAASIQAALIVGVAVASPVIAYQVSAFIAPALHADERRVIAVLAPASLLLFLAGAAFAVLLLVPTALRFLYAYAGALGAEALARPADLLTFTGLSALLMGAAFQLPLVMVALSRLGVVHPRAFVRHWRGVVVGTLVVAAIATPDPTVTSQMFVAVPTLALYFVGIGLAYAFRRRA